MIMLQKVRRRVSEQGIHSVPGWALRWVYWRGGLYRFHLHLLPAQIRHSLSVSLPRRWLDFKRNELFSLRNRLLLNRAISVRVGDSLIQMTPTGAEAASIWSGARFEQREVEFILQVLGPEMVFLDIGANVGLFSLAAAKRHPKAKVYAFEPCKWTFQILQRNLQLNSLDNVQAYRTALGDYTGEAVLQVNAVGRDGLNTIGRPSHTDCQIVAQEKVPITTLDAFLVEHGIGRVDVMKVDVEGAELLVFQGAKNLLMREDAPLILYEGYSWCTKGFSYHPVEIMWFLQNCGYSFFVFDDQTGKVTPRQPAHGYDAMVIAAKPTHLSLVRELV